MLFIRNIFHKLFQIVNLEQFIYEGRTIYLWMGNNLTVNVEQLIMKVEHFDDKGRII
jgi:uncharacterized lipoprotein YajG